MSAIIMNGKKVANEVELALKRDISVARLIPRLLIVTDDSDPASRVYIRNKVKAAERCGIEAVVVNILERGDLHEVTSMYDEFDGIIVQLPMRVESVANYLIREIPANKDVDGLSYGEKSYFAPCTPSGIMRLLDYYKIPIEGAHAVIVGRSKLVGRPLAQMLLNRNATVTVCHSKTQQLWTHTVQADILISAVGSPKLINGYDIGGGSVVIDVGINRVDGKLCGDVDYEMAKNVAGHITPVPGGVGPMTVAMLMENTYRAAMLRDGW